MPSDTTLVSTRQAPNAILDLDNVISLKYQIGMSDDTDTTLKDARNRAGLSQAELAKRANTSQPQIKRLEKGERKMTLEWAARLAPHLDMAPEDLFAKRIDYLRERAQEIASRSMDIPNYAPPPLILGARDFKLFASAECGSGEMQVFQTEPYAIVQRPWYVLNDPDAFAVVLTGESMEPIYEAGEIAVVSPRAPLVKGKEALFTGTFDGEFRASFKRYRGQTGKHWIAQQFNPEGDIKLDRAIWTNAYRVLGSFDG